MGREYKFLTEKDMAWIDANVRKEGNMNEPKHQWTVMFNYTKNGVARSENFTERNDNWDELMTFRKKIIDAIPSAEQFPNDEGSQAQVKTVGGVPTCPEHNKALTKGQWGYYCKTKTGEVDGKPTWCKFKYK